ncbi:nitroreductase family protein [Actinokineospora sp. NPDC004072]
MGRGVGEGHPDEFGLAAETQFIVATDGDTRRDHLGAGMALQRLWLTAVASGLAGSLITQPLHVSEARAALVTDLGLPGPPQAVLRIGHPAHVTPPTHRRPLADLVR